MNPVDPEARNAKVRNHDAPMYDYFHDVDYLDYFDSGWNDYFDDVDYFLSNPKTVVPNPKIPDPMCDPNPSPLYPIYVSYIKSCIIN